MMKHCETCGAWLPDDSEFDTCPECRGEPTTATESVQRIKALSPAQDPEWMSYARLCVAALHVLVGRCPQQTLTIPNDEIRDSLLKLTHSKGYLTIQGNDEDDTQVFCAVSIDEVVN